MYRGTEIKIITDNRMRYPERAKRKYHSKISYPIKIPFKNEGKMTFFRLKKKKSWEILLPKNLNYKIKGSSSSLREIRPDRNMKLQKRMKSTKKR